MKSATITYCKGENENVLSIDSISKLCIVSTHLKYRVDYDSITYISISSNTINFQIPDLKDVKDICLFEENCILLKENQLEVYNNQGKLITYCKAPLFKSKEMIEGIAVEKENNGTTLWKVQPHVKQKKHWFKKATKIVDTAQLDFFMNTKIIRNTTCITVMLSDGYTAMEYQYFNTKTFAFESESEFGGIF